MYARYDWVATIRRNALGVSRALSGQALNSHKQLIRQRSYEPANLPHYQANAKNEAHPSLLEKKTQENENILQLTQEHQHNEQQPLDGIKLAESIYRLDAARATHKLRPWHQKISQYFISNRAYREVMNGVAALAVQATTGKNRSMEDLTHSVHKGAKNLFSSNLPCAITRRAGFLTAAAAGFVTGSAQVAMLGVGTAVSVGSVFLQRYMYATGIHCNLPRCDINSKEGNASMTALFKKDQNYYQRIDTHGAEDDLPVARKAFSQHTKRIPALMQDLQNCLDKLRANPKKELSRRDEEAICKLLAEVANIQTAAHSVKKAHYRYQAEHASIKRAFRALHITAGIRVALHACNAILYASSFPTLGHSLLGTPLMIVAGGVLAVAELCLMYKLFARDYAGMTKQNILGGLKTDYYLNAKYSRDDVKKTYEDYLREKQNILAQDASKKNQSGTEMDASTRDQLHALTQRYQNIFAAKFDARKTREMWREQPKYRFDMAKKFVQMKLDIYAEQLKKLDESIHSSSTPKLLAERDVIFAKQANWLTEQKRVRSLADAKSTANSSNIPCMPQIRSILLNQNDAPGLIAQCLRTRDTINHRRLEVFAGTLPSLTISAGLDAAYIWGVHSPKDKPILYTAALLNTNYMNNMIPAAFANPLHAPKKTHVKYDKNGNKTIETIKASYAKRFFDTVCQTAYRPFLQVKSSYDLHASRQVRYALRDKANALQQAYREHITRQFKLRAKY